MTYRRILRYFLIGNTLLLAVLWWLSLRPDASFNVFVPGRHFHVRLHQGAVIMVTHAGPYPSFDVELFKVPAISMAFLGKFPHGPAGALRMGSSDAFPTATGYSIHYLYGVVPVWLAYLLVTGAGMALLKWAERRSLDDAELKAARATAETSGD